MKASHTVRPVFDDPNLVSAAGLVPMLRLAEAAGLHQLLADRLTVNSPNAGVKVTSVVGGMLAGANCIDDLDLLRHGGMRRLFGGARAPSTLGTFLRCFTHGHACRAGDTLVVTKLGRSVPDARDIVGELTGRGVALQLGGSVHDPTVPVGRLLFNALAMVAEFESDLIKARTREGMAIAKQNGRLKGFRRSSTPGRRRTWWRCISAASTRAPTWLRCSTWLG